MLPGLSPREKPVLGPVFQQKRESGDSSGMAVRLDVPCDGDPASGDRTPYTGRPLMRWALRPTVGALQGAGVKGLLRGGADLQHLSDLLN